MKSRSASFDCPYARHGPYFRSLCRSSKFILPKRAALLLSVTTRAASARRSSGSRRPVSAKCPRWLVPSCSSKPSAVTSRFGHRHDPCVVDEQVERLIAIDHPLREVADRSEAREVQRLGGDRRAGMTGRDVRDGRGALARVAHREDHLRSRGRPAGVRSRARCRCSPRSRPRACRSGPGSRCPVSPPWLPTDTRRLPVSVLSSRRGTGRRATATSPGCRDRRGTSCDSR